MKEWNELKKINEMDSIFYRTFINSPVLIAISDFDSGKFIMVNDAFTKKLGYTEHEVIGHTASELSLFPNMELVRRVAKELREVGRIEQVKLVVCDKLGNYHRGIFSVELYVNNNQKIIITTMTDVTKYDDLQSRIRKNFEHLNLMIEYLSDAVWIINCNGVILDVNLKASYDTGYSKEELVGKNIEKIDPTNGRSKFPRIFDMLLERGFIKYVGKHIRKDGSIMDIEANATTIEIEGEILYICTTRDVTAGKTFEAQFVETQKLSALQTQLLKENNRLLEISEHRNRAIISVLPDMLFIYNSNGYFIDCQTNNESNLFLSKSSFVGKHMSEVMPSDISEKGLECIKKTLVNKKLESFEYSLNISKEIKYFETRMVMSSENEVLAIVRDITANKKEQELILDISYKDYLTGLFNRRYFEEYLLSIDETHYIPTSILMIDVNGLKLTNDAFGHIVGDNLLKRVSDVLIKTCPDNTAISRIGGDEFVIVITNYTHEKSAELVDRIYRSIEDITDMDVIVSVSIGWQTRKVMEISLRETFILAENHMFRKKLVESQSMRHQTVAAILNTLNEKNERERLHSEQVSILSRRIAEAMGFNSQVVKEIEIAGLLHDIGKIAIREDVLNKPGKLTDEEYDEIKRHCESGYHILKTVDEYSSLADDILAHHEKLDGSGYPRGLKGEEIPMVARIIAVADAYEAMISDRAYRKGIPHDMAINELVRCSGTQFDSEIVKVFIMLFSEVSSCS